MRIIAGSAGGRVFRAPRGLPVRPTTDRTKEAIFNYLDHRIFWEETRVLDLFAGIGSLSLECLSRGAREAVAVDQHYKCCQFIKTTAEEFQLDKISVVKRDVRTFLHSNQMPFDLILADPPYNLEWINGLWPLISESGCIGPNSLVLIEHAKGAMNPLPEDCLEQRTYGQSIISIFKKSSELKA